MPRDQNEPRRPTSASIQPKLTALTVPTSAVPLALLRQYSSTKPLRRCPEHPPQQGR
jgi:hypothetical protein